ncbi:hypothetical protein LKL35_07180 [Streptomyces sp. ET3-23]|nr:hypothetical protein [Streptomyces sp. ET3-23]
MLGATGSVSSPAADVITAHPDRFRAAALAAGGTDPGLMACQVPRTGARMVTVGPAAALGFTDALRSTWALPAAVAKARSTATARSSRPTPRPRSPNPSSP